MEETRKGFANTEADATLHRHFAKYKFSLRRPQLSAIKFLFAVNYIFFLFFSEITFTFMWWEKQGKVYVGTLKAAATSKSGSALPK